MDIQLGIGCLAGMFCKAHDLAPGSQPLDNMLSGISIGDPTTAPVNTAKSGFGI